MNLTSLHEFATRTAYKAGKITLGYFNTGIQHDLKADQSPVTVADKAAEEFIRKEIESNFPSHAILGEEYGLTGPKGASHKWIIDPIDGTKSFMRGVPLYAVLIGLEIDGVVRVGAAYYPGTDEMLTGVEGGGAYWNGRRTFTSDNTDISSSYVCFTNIMNMEKYGHGEEWNAISKKAFSTRGWSDAYGHLLVATGRVEVMLDPIMNEWDCGPFPVILREANGYFGSWDGNEGHQHEEALSCGKAILPTVLKIFEESGK